MRETPNFVPVAELDSDGVNSETESDNYWKEQNALSKKAYQDRLKQDRAESAPKKGKPSGYEKWEKESGPNVLKSEKFKEQLEELKKNLPLTKKKREE